jgi:undecaprenyl-diphosphatase
MSQFHLFLIALIQGVTEFLPISSSGHLILLPSLTGLADQGQVIDVALALGGIGHLLRGRQTEPGAQLAMGLIIATIPVIIFGLFLSLTGLDDALRSIAVIGWTMLIFGVVLYWADQKGPRERSAESWTYRHALIMGLWQAIALIPGTSRSGITITSARLLGYDRESAARLSMLMSIPTIIASGVLLGSEVISTADAETARNGAIAAGYAFVAALAALTIMMRLLRTVSFTPYVIYRVILGIILLIIAYS